MITIGVLISAHVPRARNGMLQRCLDSVWQQERLPDQVAIAIDHEGNGAAWCKNQAAEMLNTDYLMVIDSDDTMKPHHVRIHEEAANATGADLVYSWFDTMPPGGDPFPASFFSDPWDDQNPRHTTTTVMVSKKAFLAVGGYTSDPRPNAIYADDDWRLTYGIWQAGFKIHHIADRSWTWYHHQTNTSGLGRNWK